MNNFIHKNRPCDGRGVALLRLIPMPQDIMAKNTINIFVILLIAIRLHNAALRRSSATPLQSFHYPFSIASRLYSHFPLSLFIGIHLMLSAFCQFYHFADVSKMMGNSQPSNGKRANELKYCFNSHSWALSLIMAWR